MRIVFFGTSFFASEILSYLISNGMEIVAVVTQKNKKRNKIPVKECIDKKYSYIPIYQPEKSSTREFIEEVSKYKADLFIIVAYGQILKQDLLDVPLLGCINVHASLLPKYRGAAPIQRCLMNNEKHTGITIMKMISKLDAGDIISVASIPIDDKMIFSELEEALCYMAKPLLLNVIKSAEDGEVKGYPQEDSLATYASKISSDERHICWDMQALKIHNLVRSLSKIPGAYCWVVVNEEKKRLKILRTEVVDFKGAPKEILSFTNNNFIVACKDKSLKILEVQLEGKRSMKTSDFVLGFKEKSFFID